MGFTFKENCPDFRNTQVQNLVKSLMSYGCRIEIYDPWVKLNDLDSDSHEMFVEYPKNTFMMG